jgi:hypothetical protein
LRGLADANISLKNKLKHGIDSGKRATIGDAGIPADTNRWPVQLIFAPVTQRTGSGFDLQNRRRPNSAVTFSFIRFPADVHNQFAALARNVPLLFTPVRRLMQ